MIKNEVENLIRSVSMEIIETTIKIKVHTPPPHQTEPHFKFFPIHFIKL